jgi:hypothetical protein
MIIEPRMRGFICLTAHPKGCEQSVKNQIEYVKSKGAYFLLKNTHELEVKEEEMEINVKDSENIHDIHNLTIKLEKIIRQLFKNTNYFNDSLTL